MRQLSMKLELLEYDASNVPEIVSPKEVYVVERVFIGEDAEHAEAAAKFLASRMGLI